MLVAKEGINATFEGKVRDIEAYKRRLKKIKSFENIVFKESAGTGRAFPKLIVRVREEIVTLGAGDFNVKKETAKAITAKQLEKMFKQDEDFVVLDLRNDYEVRAGQFEKTVNPNLRNFRDLPKKLQELEHLKKKKVVAVCTGGIRCEKATCLLKREGFENLYQLKDGIHTYIQQFPAKNFKGSLFVFDNRMVTPVVPTKNRKIIGVCFSCGKKSENYYNDDSVRPSLKVICCKTCRVTCGHKLRACVV
jgi:UPF0176 protein